MGALVEDLEAKLAAARQGGGPKAAERMKSKGKLLPRERCGKLRAVTPCIQCGLTVYLQASSPPRPTFAIPGIVCSGRTRSIL
jgi:acetyl-CoA carboxylase carboxyltransferase component